MKTALVLLCLPFLLPACASKDDGGRAVAKEPGQPVDQARETGGSGLWDMLDKARREKTTRKPRVAMDAGASQLSTNLRAAVEEWWEAWRTRSEALDATADVLRAQGEDGRRIMVENLIRWYVLSRDAGNVFEVDRTRSELLRYRDEVSPYLVDGLSRGLGDSALRNMLGELLGDFGDASLSDIHGAIVKATPKGRLALARSVKLMRSQQAVPLLLDLSHERYDYRVRIEAIDGLRDLRNAKAIPVFTSCLRDADPSVRKFAARAALSPKVADRKLLEALVDCLQKALERGERETQRACVHSLRGLLGTNHGADLRAWRRAIARQGI